VNKKGAVTISIIVGVLILTLIVITTFMNPILNTSLNLKQSKEIIPDYIDNITGLERVYSILNENVSYKGSVEFPDIQKEYEVSDIDSVYEERVLDFSSNLNTFFINNETDIEIQLKFTPYGPTSSYDVRLVLNDEFEVKNEDDLSTNSVITVNKDFVYDKINNKTNYGEYKLLINANNAQVTATVTYDKLTFRELSLTGDNLEQTLVIDNRNEDVEIYFK